MKQFPKLKSKAILSPMAGVTDVAFRVLCKQLGAGLTCTEFVSSTAIVRGNIKTKGLIQKDPIEKPVQVQLFGSNTEEIVAAAKVVAPDFDIIDINCGCPAYKVIKTGAGSEMLNHPEKISKLVETLVAAVDRPITVKIRTGINEKSINALKVAKEVEKAGAAAIAIHGRTQKQGYTGIADWKIIKEVKESLSIPVIGNGDVFTPEDFVEKLEYSGVDAILIARGAMTNPYIFKQIEDFQKKGSYEPKPLNLIESYLPLAEKHHIPEVTIKHHIMSFTKGMEGSTKLRASMSTMKSIEELQKAVRLFVSKPKS